MLLFTLKMTSQIVQVKVKQSQSNDQVISETTTTTTTTTTEDSTDQEMKENYLVNNKTETSGELVLKSEKLHLTNGQGGGDGQEETTENHNHKESGETTTIDNNNNNSSVSSVNSSKTSKDLKLMLKQLQADLRTEESKLLLLKRLHYSQKYPNTNQFNNQQQQTAAAAAAAAAANQQRMNQLNGQLKNQAQNPSQKVGVVLIVFFEFMDLDFYFCIFI